MTERERLVAEAFGTNTSAEFPRLAASPDEEKAFFSSHFHPEVEFESRLASVEGAAYRGFDGLRAYRDDMLDAWDDWFQEGLECRELSDGRVLSFSRFRAHGRASGMEVDIPTNAIWEFRDGTICRAVIYGSREEALAAAGLGEDEL